MQRQLCWIGLFVIILSQPFNAQQLKFCKMIGKSVSEVIKVYGKPKHQDLSNPELNCLFYQTKTERSVFVANRKGVFQIQVDMAFDSEIAANQQISKFLSNCTSNEYQIDTLDASNYKITAPGVKMSLDLFQNNYLNKYEVKFSANKSESK